MEGRSGSSGGKPPASRGMCNFVDVPWFYRICRALPANPDPFVNFWYAARGSKVKEQPVSNANFLWNYSNTFLRSTIRWSYRFHSPLVELLHSHYKLSVKMFSPSWTSSLIYAVFRIWTGTKNLRKVLETKVWYANLSLSIYLWNVSIPM